MTTYVNKYIVLLLVNQKAVLWDNTLYDSDVEARAAIRDHAAIGSRFLVTKVVNHHVVGTLLRDGE